MAELVEAGELGPKTVNNALTVFSVCMGLAADDGLIAANPCLRVKHLPVAAREMDFLRLDEIPRYLDACPGYYRPLAGFLLGTGCRISEALAVRWEDVDLADRSVRITRQRDRYTAGTTQTKGKRLRRVDIGPQLADELRRRRAARMAGGVDDSGWLFLCPRPIRGRYVSRLEPTPPNRRTAHEWHEATLQDAGLRDMPLHSLRHTAAAAWLATGHPLMFVQRQLGHASITTTEHHYGHFERTFLKDAAARTEAAIRQANVR
jgi:integrase